ncbi:hypothetical protein ASPWEDRAFT_187308, partial [Aspergillus wentii DTO 134E9]
MARLLCLCSSLPSGIKSIIALSNSPRGLPSIASQTSRGKTVLLDYISPWNVVAMFRAGRNSHWPVVMAIIGTLFLQLVAVASTGLLTLET